MGQELASRRRDLDNPLLSLDANSGNYKSSGSAKAARTSSRFFESWRLAATTVSAVGNIAQTTLHFASIRRCDSHNRKAPKLWVLSNAQNIGCGIHLALVADFVWQPSPCRASTCIMKNDCEPTGRKPKVPQSAVELLIWPCMSSPMQFRKQSTTIQLTQRPGNPMTLSSSSLHCCQRALATPSRKPQRLRKSNTRKVTLEAALVKAMAEGSNVYWSTPVRLREP